MSELSYCFRVDSLHAIGQAKSIEYASISFDTALVARIRAAVAALNELAASGLAAPYLPVTVGAQLGLSVEFIESDGAPSGDVTLDEIRVRRTGSLELHGSNFAGDWVRAETSIEEIDMVMQAGAPRLRRRGAPRGIRI